MAARPIEHPTNARSRRTRAALLASTRSILEREGFEALTMHAVAERAGVSRGAAYLHFGSRADLVAALFEHIAATEGPGESTERVWAAPDAAAALDEWARHLARYHSRLLAVTRAIERVHRIDADAADYRARVVEAQLANCRRLATWLHDEGRLAPPWSVATATDMLWALISTDMIEGLLVDRRWSQRRLGEHLGVLLRSTFAARPSARPRRRPRS
ncbi:MAG: TetR/AcrR family transcriptional regulator, partial [Acidimicrobiales bacterium]